MTVCRCVRFWNWPALVAALAAAMLLCPARSNADDNPNGRIIAEVLSQGNRLRTTDQIRQQMISRPGITYEAATIQEDVRRLHATKWFVPNSIQILTRNESNGRVTIIVQVAELTSTVEDLQFIGAQHLSKTELQNISGVRKGEPMNPYLNEQGRSVIQKKYEEEGRFYAHVELIEGNKPTDTRVIYNIIEGPVVKVAGVDFVGVSHANSGRLRTQLVTKKAFLGFLGGKFNPMSMEVDKRQLIEYYEGLGFLDVQITPEVVNTIDVGFVRIAYHIVEGQQYHVADKQIEGNRSYSTDTLMSLTELKPGDRYNMYRAKADTTRIRDYMGARGINATVEERRFEVADQPGLVQVHYEVINDHGDRDRVGRILIDGNTVTQDRVIWNQLGLRPGQILSYPEIKVAEARLARLGIFDMENPPRIDVQQNQLDDPFKDLIVRVRETQTGQFMIGGSFNTDAGLTGNITINERNFDILRWPTSIDDFREGRAFRGAGQEFRIEAAPGTQFQRYSVTWREPYFLDTPFGVTVSDYYYERSFAEYTERRYGGRFTVDRRLDDIWRASVTTRVEGVGINNVPTFAPFTISKDEGSHFLVGLRPGITRDTRDSYIYPTTGSVFDAGVEMVMGSYTFPVGTVEFTKFFSSNRWPFAREDGSGKHVLGLRTQLSFTDENAPVFERFYGGGIRSLRGFTFRGVGPFENSLATGGTFAWLNTVEYQVPILANDKFHWAFFVDHGTVEQNVNITNYRVAVGTGIRLNIPALGPLPLALDIAVPLNQGPGDHKQLVNFSIGVFGGAGQ